MVTVSDKKIGVDANSDGVIDYYNADVVTANDYYPFGMFMPGRKYAASSSKYRYGFNGKENDNDVKGEGNQQDYGMRIYDPRLGKFLSIDPLTKSYPWYTPYQFTGNNPIKFIDLDGLEPAENPSFPSGNEVRAMATVTSIAVGAGLRNVKENLLSSGLYKKLTGDLKGNYSVKASSINYVTDTEGDPNNKFNMKVSDRKVLHVNEAEAKNLENYEAYVVDKLMVNFVGGTGSENYNFPTNGIISSKFLQSDILAAAVSVYKDNVKDGKTGTVVDRQFDFKAPQLANDFKRTGSLFSITGLTGSAKITMVQTSDGVQVRIFNIMSLYSGDISKENQNITPSKSYVRNGDNKTSYGNISMTFNLLLPYSSPLLK